MKNTCPYRDQQKRCTHKVHYDKSLRTSSKKKSICPYNNPEKCEMYQLWKDGRKANRKLFRAIRDEIYEGHRK